MKHWRTTVSGLILALTTYVAGHPTEFAPWVIQAAQALASLAALALGFFAGDKGEKPT